MHRDDTVLYIHSKGSYHPKPSNERLRKYATYAASSKECTHMPDGCNVCGNRMTLFPYPHLFGNMWTAKCAYVSQLVDPLAFDRMLVHLPSKYPEWCAGTGRYASEHWILSHPAANPCDVSPEANFVKAYENVPVPGSPLQLERAPRMVDAELYRKPYQWMWFWNRCPSLKDTKARILLNYKNIYPVFDARWWGDRIWW